MLTGAVWYLVGWDKFHSPYYGRVSSALQEGNRGALASIPYALWTGVAPAVLMGLGPYHYMFTKPAEWGHTATMIDDELRSVRHIARHFPRLGPMNAAVSQRMATRAMYLRVGARLVPFLGWALLAYDVAQLSKWYIESDWDPLGLRD